jgi:hypothetical protein
LMAPTQTLGRSVRGRLLASSRLLTGRKMLVFGRRPVDAKNPQAENDGRR